MKLLKKAKYKSGRKDQIKLPANQNIINGIVLIQLLL